MKTKSSTLFLCAFFFIGTARIYFVNYNGCTRHTLVALIMKSKILLAAMVAALAFSSCSVHTRSIQSSPVISRNVQLDPIKADIEVNQDKKLVGEGYATYLFGIRVSNLTNQKQVEGINYSDNPVFPFLHRGRNTARSIAAYQALEECPECDVLVNPKYEVTVKKSPLGLIFKKYIVRVSGYGAKYKNFRTEKQTKIIGSQNKEYIVVEEND